MGHNSPSGCPAEGGYRASLVVNHPASECYGRVNNHPVLGEPV